MIVIDNPADLQRFRTARKRHKLSSSLKFDDLPAGELTGLNERLASFQKECGCSFGAKMSVTTLIGSVLGLFLLDGFSWSYLVHLPLAAVTTFLAAGLGKLIGIKRARRNFDREIDSLILKFSHS